MTGILIAAWLDVRTRPLRTMAAIAGMVAAVVAVVLVDAAGVVSREANDIYLARQYGLPVTWAVYAEAERPAPEDDARLLATLRDNGITAVSPDAGIAGTVTFEGAPVDSAVRWLASPFRDIRIVEVVAGAWPVETADSDTLHVVVPEGWAQQTLGLSDREVVGRTLGLTPYGDGTGAFDARTSAIHPMVVDAVVSADTNAFDPTMPSVAVVSDRSDAALPRDFGTLTWLVRVNPADTGLLRELVDGVTDASGQPVYRMDRADQGDTLAPVLEQQSVTARAITVVALAIGGLGILGVGIASVRERARDYGLRRALGASTARIFTGVIAQTLIEVLLAVAVAVPLSAVLLELFARDLVLDVLPLPPSTALPVRSALVGLAGAMLVGLVAGLLPAVTAARASVVQALRA